MRRIFLPLALVLAAVVAMPATRASAASAVLPTDGYAGVDGHGWGHAHGMGQWGAKGLADQGKTWTEIVTHYYTGIAVATRPAETIKVLIADAGGLTVFSQSHPFSVYWTGGSKIADSSTQFPFLRAASSGGGMVIQKSAAYGGPWTDVASGTGIAEFHPGTQPLGLVGSNGSVRYYRGQIITRRPSGSSSLIAINDLSMDAYLYGVVPREVSSSWATEALRAQAVAARTYAAYKKDAARAGGKLYDICATTSCQVYGGYGSASNTTDSPHALEASSTNKAANDTTGKVLTYQGKVILAEYSSSTGGYSADGGQPYLKPVPDPTDAAAPASEHAWSTRVSIGSIQSKWPGVGSLTGIRVTKRNGFGDWGGRVVEMILDGTSGSVTISGDAFRSKMGLKSNWFRVRTYSASLAGSSASVTGPSGSDIPASVSLKNTGSAEWKVGGPEILATYPSGRVSRFAGSEWISASKAARITRNLSRAGATTVGPGEIAELRFTLHTLGVTPGSYVESFRPLEDGVTWMNDAGVAIAVTVLSSWLEDQGNVLTNSSFEASWSAWQGVRTNAADGPATGTVRAGARSMHLAAGGQKAVRQTLSLAGGPGRRLAFGGWARTVATSAAGGVVQLNVALHNIDGSMSWYPVAFARGAHDFQYAERLIVATKQFSSAEVWAQFYDQRGNVYFDALRLMDTWLSNPSFDLGTSGWSGSGIGSGDGPTPNLFRDGYRSMHFAGGTKSLTQRIALAGPASRRYTVAGWTKGDNNNAAGATSIVVAFNNTDRSISRVTMDGVAASHDWRYVEQQAIAPKSFTSIDVSVAVSAQTGNVFFDSIRFRENRLSNGSFELGLDPWTPAGGFGGTDGVSSSLPRDAATSLTFAGDPNPAGVIQRLASGGSAGARILVGAWNRTTGAAASGGGVWLAVGFRNKDGTTTWRNLYYPAAAHDWMHSEMLATADKAYNTVDVYLMQNKVSGQVFFDGVALWAII